MTPEEYIRKVLQTESKDFSTIMGRMSSEFAIRLDHASDGLVTEAGEFKDAIKKYKFYGKPMDQINLMEEIGDILWYAAIACNVLNVTFEDVMNRNIAKLQKRYGITFNEEGAINRDLSAERYILEKEKDNKVHLVLTGNQYTSCGQPSILVDNATSSIPAVNCDKCLKAAKVNYEGEILHFNTHGLEIDGQPTSRVCGAETGLMIGDPKRVTCIKCKEEMVRLHFDRMQ